MDNCKICGRESSLECICPQCSICHEYGNPDCYGEVLYKKNSPIRQPWSPHGLEYNKEQVTAMLSNKKEKE